MCTRNEMGKKIEIRSHGIAPLPSGVSPLFRLALKGPGSSPPVRYLLFRYSTQRPPRQRRTDWGLAPSARGCACAVDTRRLCPPRRRWGPTRVQVGTVTIPPLASFLIGATLLAWVAGPAAGVSAVSVEALRLFLLAACSTLTSAVAW